MPTIYAPLTPSAPHRAISVVRLSGGQARAALACLIGGEAHLPKARTMALRTLRHPHTNDVLDSALVVWFSAPHSYTGEDVVELHLHGGRAVLADTLAALAALPEVQLAEPGAFTRRAFLNGRLDLTEAEAIADLIAAETTAQRRQALRHLAGSFGDWCALQRTALTRALAYGEVMLDFADEDLPPEMDAIHAEQIVAVRDALATQLAAPPYAERLRNGFYVAIVGVPNVGKSSLLNALARREAAIVSDIAGTTRDVIDVHLDLGGWPVTLADTAGMRESVDVLETEGVRRTLSAAQRADALVWVVDDPAHVHSAVPLTLPPLLGFSGMPLPADVPVITVLNKGDRLPPDHPVRAETAVVTLSATTGDGLAILEKRLQEVVAAGWEASAADGALITRARHREALESCHASLSRALNTQELELRTEDVRLALRALGRITGHVDVEAVLDVVFRDFCLGK